MSLQAAVPVLALLLFSCGPTPGGVSGVAETSEGAPVDSPGRGVGAIDVCAHVPLTAVARVLDRDATRGVAQATMGQWAADCTYTFEHDASNEYAMVWVYPPGLWAPEADGEAERIEGLGDGAFLSRTASFARVHVLLEGDVYIDTRAGNPEAARGLAELAIERLARASVVD